MSHQSGYPSWPPQQHQPPAGYPATHQPPAGYPSTQQKPGQNAPYAQPYAAASAPPAPWNQHGAPPPSASQSHYPQSATYPPAPTGYPPYGQGGYGSYAQFPPGTDPEVIRMFQEADRDGSGVIDEYELQRVLSQKQPFSLRTVRLMVHMFGAKDSKKLGPTEFAKLWKSLKDWRGIFERFDRDHSGSIDKGEMRDALLSLGYSLAAPILDCLLLKYDRTGKAKAMDYDSFIECGLIVKGLTEKFKEQDKQLKGSATLDYQTFMLMVLPFIVA